MVDKFPGPASKAKTKGDRTIFLKIRPKNFIDSKKWLVISWRHERKFLSKTG
jgi:hypothetical protein